MSLAKSRTGGGEGAHAGGDGALQAVHALVHLAWDAALREEHDRDVRAHLGRATRRWPHLHGMPAAISNVVRMCNSCGSLKIQEKFKAPKRPVQMASAIPQ